jgi:hypothetical protein
MTSFDYGMYSNIGNEAIHGIVRQAEIMKYTWPQVQKALIDLSYRNKDLFGEAFDTEVRECVYKALKFTTPFYS